MMMVLFKQVSANRILVLASVCAEDRGSGQEVSWEALL